MSAALFRRPWLRAVLLLSAPAAWFVLIYLAALVAAVPLGAVERRLVHAASSSTAGRSSNFETLVNVPAYRTIALRTIGIAAAVTVTDALLAVPFAFFAARIASQARCRRCCSWRC